MASGSNVNVAMCIGPPYIADHLLCLRQAEAGCCAEGIASRHRVSKYGELSPYTPSAPMGSSAVRPVPRVPRQHACETWRRETCVARVRGAEWDAPLFPILITQGCVLLLAIRRQELLTQCGGDALVHPQHFAYPSACAALTELLDVCGHVCRKREGYGLQALAIGGEAAPAAWGMGSGMCGDAPLGQGLW